MRVVGATIVAALNLLAGIAYAQSEITIAVVGPMTGQYAMFGEQMRRGAQVAVADINSAGGVLGQRLRLEIGDDACDPRQAVAVANQMVSRRVSLVVGHFCSGASIPASEVYAEERVLQISPGSTNPILTERGARFSNVFRLCGRDDQQGRIAAAYILANLRGRPVAVIADRSQYGMGLANVVRETLQGAGAQIPLSEQINQGDSDFSSLISRMRSAHIEVIYFGGYHTEAALLVRQSREQGLGAIFITGDAAMTPEFWSIAGPAAQEARFTSDADFRRSPGAAAVVARFRGENFEPTGYTLHAYAAIQVWAQAVGAAGTTTSQTLVSIMRQREFQTVLGSIRFDEKGDTRRSLYSIYVWRNGVNADECPDPPNCPWQNVAPR